MADTVEIELISNEDIKTAYPFYNQYGLAEWMYKKGKNPMILHVDVVADSLTNTSAVIGEPTNDPVDFVAGQDIFIRSSNAADTEKSVYVIGQKFGLTTWGIYELTTDDTDGTTPVDTGKWNFISFFYKKDAAAGNIIIDDDGASTTVYATMALGATVDLGVVYCPTGYSAAILSVSSWLIAAPANINTTDQFTLGADFGWGLNTTRPNYDSTGEKYRHLEHTGEKIPIKGYYTGTSETDAKIEAYILFWEI